ncbi:23S rRNA (guanosine-2'-O-) -methyltransferase rlmB [Caenispirillum salinarum AK4]|uniref:23S rRNA (Guanosine-2'-O-)-methyltransferase rlmB n=1 Tax=Caenispirillum salinarum AK4 TaxID=1238182 RepID=K9HQY0_9PROT|nr:23S rRNA (guanosine(2251)-2'-O)-methyltransferase RlmB [Caenispirillum salinarum]EKV32658.1 23S rRNA (guanosine-2'-O-) -methyltransferase rlmB [Caenispirillum salinarum AK4]
MAANRDKPKGKPHRRAGGKPPRGTAPAGASAGGEGWLYGRHPVEAALANPARKVRTVVGTREALEDLRALLDARDDLPVVRVAEKSELDAMLPPGAVHQGLALSAAPLPVPGIEDLLRQAADVEAGVILALDQVTDPHNVGAILRSAAAFGALAVLTQDRHAPEETAVLAKSASGAVERVPLVRVGNLKQALEKLKAENWWVAGMAADAPATLAGAGLSGKVVLVLGSEGTGMRRLTREACDHLVRLPMTGAMESLNVSNAAAVALYELRREALEEKG